MRSFPRLSALATAAVVTLASPSAASAREYPYYDEHGPDAVERKHHTHSYVGLEGISGRDAHGFVGELKAEKTFLDLSSHVHGELGFALQAGYLNRHGLDSALIAALGTATVAYRPTRNVTLGVEAFVGPEFVDPVGVGGERHAAVTAGGGVIASFRRLVLGVFGGVSGSEPIIKASVGWRVK